MARVKVKAHKRSDGTKVKGHKRTILSKRKGAHSKVKGLLARAIRMGNATPDQIKHLKNEVAEYRNKAGASRFMKKYAKKSRKHKARSDKRTDAFHKRAARRRSRR